MKPSDPAEPANPIAANDRVRVWDRAVRAFHWSLATLVLLALTSGFALPTPWFNLHVVIGTAIAGLLVFRLVWGLVGSEYSRFTSFIFHPRRILDHLRAIGRRQPSHHLGHNPAGAVMVTLLLATLVLGVASGFVLLGGTFKEGPLGTLISFATGHRAGRLHTLIAYGLIGLVAIHWAGVFVESWISRHNLVRAMINGEKPLAPGQTRPELRPGRPGLAAVMLAGLGGVLALFLVWAGQQEPAGLPALKTEPVVKAECGGCHWAYHPSLLPAASWHLMIDRLDDHFGEDATIAPERASVIRSWLTSHAAETWDTLASHSLQVVATDAPLQITATPFWKARHHGISPAVFKATKGGKGNCTACHDDAESGRFSFRMIRPLAETPR